MKGKDLTERVYREIKRDLMLRKLPSSELFSEQMLADRYQCSRTPAREAAGRLVSEGFLNKFPSKGYIVRLPSEREMNEMRFTCYVLESAALKQAHHTAYKEEFQKLLQMLDRPTEDPELAAFSDMIFHTELCRLSGNQTMVGYIEQLHSLMMRGESQPVYRGSTFLGTAMPDPGSPQPEHEKKEIHRAILLALMDNNLPDALRHLCTDFYPSVPFQNINLNM